MSNLIEVDKKSGPSGVTVEHVGPNSSISLETQTPCKLKNLVPLCSKIEKYEEYLSELYEDAVVNGLPEVFLEELGECIECNREYVGVVEEARATHKSQASVYHDRLVRQIVHYEFIYDLIVDDDRVRH